MGVLPEAVKKVGGELEKKKIDLNCCLREQARELIRMNKRVSEQVMLNYTDL